MHSPAYIFAQHFNAQHPGLTASDQPAQLRADAKAIMDALVHDSTRLEQLRDTPNVSSLINSIDHVSPDAGRALTAYFLNTPETQSLTHQFETVLEVIKHHSPETYTHITHHTPLASAVFLEQAQDKNAAIEQLPMFFFAAAAHDFGKLAIHDALLHKTQRIEPEAIHALCEKAQDTDGHLRDYLMQLNDGQMDLGNAEQRDIAEKVLLAYRDAFKQMDPTQLDALFTPHFGTLSDTERQAINVHDDASVDYIDALIAHGALPDALKPARDLVSMDGYREMSTTTNTLSDMRDTIHLTDMFDALTAHRCYRAGMPTEKALRIIADEAHSKGMNPQIVETLTAMVSEAPTQHHEAAKQTSDSQPPTRPIPKHAHHSWADYVTQRHESPAGSPTLH